MLVVLEHKSGSAVNIGRALNNVYAALRLGEADSLQELCNRGNATRSVASAWFSDEYFMTEDRAQRVCKSVYMRAQRRQFIDGERPGWKAYTTSILAHVAAAVVVVVIVDDGVAHILVEDALSVLCICGMRKRAVLSRTFRNNNWASDSRIYSAVTTWKTSLVCSFRARIIHSSRIDPRLLCEAAHYEGTAGPGVLHLAIEYRVKAQMEKNFATYMWYVMPYYFLILSITTEKKDYVLITFYC